MDIHNLVELKPVKGEARVDSRLIARELGNQHESMIRLIDEYQSDFEEFGVVRFQIGKPPKGSKGGRPERFALLNEDQAYLFLTYAKNTPEARRLKVNLVKAFARFREGRQVAADYLPFYHTLHNEVSNLAQWARLNGSTTPEEFFHVNANRLINRAFGLDSDARAGLPPMLKVMVTGAQALAAETLSKALAEELGHKEAYQRVKQAVERYAAGGLTLLPPMVKQ
ncbi:MAG: Rha family transcriptional regulator [Proteobacteria bacterium]|nr:Rha family transcriptional regulator [Pseudomonadota bacterium]